MKRAGSFFSSMNISRKFSVIGIVFIAVFLAVISVSMVIIINRVLGASIFEEVRDKSAVVVDNFKNMEQQALSSTEWFTNSARLADAFSSGNRAEAVSVGKLAMKSIGFDYFVVTDINGRVFMRAHQPGKFGDSIIDQVNIKKALKGQSSVGLEEGEIVKFSIRAGAPLKDRNGRIIGAISLGYILSNNNFVDSQRALLKSHITIFQGEKRLSTTIQDEKGNRIIGTNLGIKRITDRVLVQGENYYGDSSIQGKKYSTAYLPLRDVENKVVGMLFLGVEASVIDGLINKLLSYLTIAICLTSVIFVILLRTFLKNTIFKRLQNINVRLKEIAEGDGDLTVRIEETSRDEIGGLADSFNRFVEKIRGVITDIKKVSVELNNMAGELNKATVIFSDNSQAQASSIEEVNATTEELSAGMEMISENTKVQDESMNTLVTSMTDLSALITETGKSIDESLKLGSSMSAEARTGEESLNSMTESMGKIEESSSQVYNIIKIINDISEQINLLSLNAAIESARAGEAGRGFAVVADEISKLADQTAGSINDINRLIKSNEEEIKNGSSRVEDAGRVFSVIIHGVEQIGEMMKRVSGFMNRQVEARDEMTRLSNVVKTKTEEIKNATGEHRLSTEEIVRASGGINEMTQSIAGAAEEMASMAEEITAMSETLKSRVEFFRV